jgi:hypothetical protein
MNACGQSDRTLRQRSGCSQLMPESLARPGAFVHNLSLFERAVLEAIVCGDDPLLTTLAAQLRVARVRDREHTNVGCFVNFALPIDVAPAAVPNWRVGDVHLDVDGCDYGAAAILFVHEGRASFLELVVYDGLWPTDPVIKRIQYMSRGGLRDTRDMAEFRSMAGLCDGP